MEQLNRIELRERSKRKAPDLFRKCDGQDYRCHDYAYKDREGAAVIDTSWHSVVAWEGKNIHGLDKIVRGTKVHVTGRLRYQKYTGGLTGLSGCPRTLSPTRLR